MRFNPYCGHTTDDIWKEIEELAKKAELVYNNTIDLGIRRTIAVDLDKRIQWLLEADNATNKQREGLRKFSENMLNRVFFEETIP